MTKDEIMHVLRLVALGRIGHPEQERFCEALEKVFAADANAKRERVPVAEALEREDLTDVVVVLDGPVVKADAEWTPPKRGRKPKAD